MQSRFTSKHGRPEIIPEFFPCFQDFPGKGLGAMFCWHVIVSLHSAAFTVWIFQAHSRPRFKALIVTVPGRRYSMVPVVKSVSDWVQTDTISCMPSSRGQMPLLCCQLEFY